MASTGLGDRKKYICTSELCVTYSSQEMRDNDTIPVGKISIAYTIVLRVRGLVVDSGLYFCVCVCVHACVCRGCYIK